jgi:hypothetical protein
MDAWLRRCAFISFIALIAIARGDTLHAQVTTRAPADRSNTGAIVGIVITKEGALRLGFSVVSISLGRERFTNDSGAFTLTDLPPGPIQLRVRHLGYSPADVPIIIRAGETDTIQIALAHIAVRLIAVEVHGYPECKNPGPPDPAKDSAFAIAFDQLRQNAEQYRLLTREYPFNEAIERTMATAHADGQLTMEITDTLAVRSIDQWRYKPGDMIATEKSHFAFLRGSMMLNLPTLTSFADPLFLANHCFHNGGLESVEGKQLLRIDFVAASRLRDPDVDGAIYLDPDNFHIRRAFLHLSKIPRSIHGLAQVEVTTIFGEIYPSVPLIAAVSSVNQFSDDADHPDAPTRAIEEQRLIAVNFLKSRPGDEAKKAKP